ncbi:MAG: hypothetical protein OJF47_000705 [Nitrospira sp.]|nr:MAG: hypothetical protein OJF47_000705 [Nitrospira sp.]
MRKSMHIIATCGALTALAMLIMATSHNATTLSIAQAQALPEKKPFKVFDGTLYTDKPDLSQYGIQPITITYAGQFGKEWFKDAARLPEKESVQRVAREAEAKGGHAVIDIEHWPLKGDSSQVQESLTKYMTVLRWFKEAAPGLTVGYYGAPPLRDYWRAINPPTSKEWQSYSGENDRLQPLAGAVDVFFPSLYTFYTDQGGWVRYAYGQIAEARRYGNGKPVYVFLWPQYHDSNRKLAGTYLPADYWRLELETAKQYADGIIIWGGWGTNNRPAQWDDNAGWWKATKDFMKTVMTSRHPGDKKAE